MSDVDISKTRKLEWRNMWMHTDWQPMRATTLREAQSELNNKMPYTEDGTKVRDAESKEEWNFTPPREQLNFGP